MRRAWGAVLLVGICLALLAPPVASGSTLPTGFRDDVVFTGIEEPTTFRFAPDGRVFVAEKTGRILLFESVDDPTGTVFADLRTQVYDTHDRGLLGLEVDPAFPVRPYVYALYTYDHVLGEEEPAPRWGEAGESGDGCDEDLPAGVDACPVSGRLVRLTVDEGGAGDGAVEDGGGEPAEQVLVEDWCTQFSSHSIGDLEFGPDGWLYASGGEGADANDVDYGQLGFPQINQCDDPPARRGGMQSPPSAEGGALRAQDARTPADPLDLAADPTGLSGTVIRIDPDSGEGVPGNPMSGSADANERRIVGFGFRNPFRFALDPGGGRVYVGNVGWGRFEEIDRFAVDPARAFNSGWPCYEGPGPNLNYQGLGLALCDGLYADSGAAPPPFFHYRHGYPVVAEETCPEQGAGSAVSGLAFYEEGPFPDAYSGALFFADVTRGCIFSMLRDENGDPDPLTATTFMSEAGPYPGIDLEVGPDGALYYAQLFGSGFAPGSVHRISYDPVAPFARLSASPEWWPAEDSPQDVELDAGASTDPAGKPLSFEWDFDGDGTFTGPDAAQVTKAFAGGDNVAVAVRVGNGTGKTSVARLTLYPGDTPPEPEIEEPLGSLDWAVGEQIYFDGAATDAEEGGIDNSSLYWKTRLYHCPAACHAHPLRVFPAVGAGNFSAPDHDYPSHLEISLTAIDERGLSATKAVAVYPRTVNLRIASDPPGVELGAGTLAQAAPFDLTAIENSTLTLTAPATARLGGADHAWVGWSDNGARVHAIAAKQPATYTASYWPWPHDPPPPPRPPEPESPERPQAKRPKPQISKHPAKRTASAVARFVFAAEGDGSYRCKLDAGEFKPCRSPRVYRGLRPGWHVLRIVAVGADGGSSKPAVFRWRVFGMVRAAN